MRNTVTEYIYTFGTETFKTFLLKKFKHNQIIKIFDNWVYKGSGEYLNDDATLIFNEKTIEYSINSTIKLPFPETVNDFIHDMHRLKIDLQWSPSVLNNFKPKDYLPREGIKDYYKELLDSMDKGVEINF